MMCARHNTIMDWQEGLPTCPMCEDDRRAQYELAQAGTLPSNYSMTTGQLLDTQILVAVPKEAPDASTPLLDQ